MTPDDEVVKRLLVELFLAEPRKLRERQQQQETQERQQEREEERREQA